MTLLHNWRDVLRRAWSIRLLLLAAALSALEAALPLVDLFDIPRWVMIALAVATPLVVAAAFIARLLAQKNLLEN